MLFVQTKPFVYLVVAAIYQVLLYGYMYTKLSEMSERADILGMCSSLLTTCIMTLPALEVVRVMLIESLFEHWTIAAVMSVTDDRPLLNNCKTILCFAKQTSMF